MPRAKSSKSSDQSSKALPPRSLPSDAPWGGFVNIRLSDEEKEVAQAWIRESEREAVQLLTDDLADGYKFSLSYDGDNQSFIATYTGAGWDGCNVRCAMSARAGTWFEALALLVWKHHIHAGRDWGQYYHNGSKVSPFG